MKNQSYYNEQKIVNTNKLKNVLKDLPDFALDFFVGIESKTTSLTRLNYAYDLRLFFKWAINETNLFRDKSEIYVVKNFNKSHPFFPFPYRPVCFPGVSRHI